MVLYIYVVGDVVESYFVIIDKLIYCLFGLIVNKMGRIVGDIIIGGILEYCGILGIGIVWVFDLVVVYIGLIEKEVKLEGLEIVIFYNIKLDYVDYLGGKELIIKVLVDKSSGRIFGV